MGEKLVVGPISKGLKTDLEPFNIDNDSFPTLLNAYQWRGRVKRKRGTSVLTQSTDYPSRLLRWFDSTNSAYGSTSSINLVAGAANILTDFSLESSGNIIPGTVTIINTTVPQTYTDPAKNGNLTGSIGGTGTINYATGAITITGGAANAITAAFLYAPSLPVLGIEDLILIQAQLPNTLAFDTKYAYGILTTSPYASYDVSFYKNPSTATYTNYVQKTNWTATRWNGQDYQQFWSTNYQGAFWVTNGIQVPFNTSNIGMQFKNITNVAIVAVGPPAVATLSIAAHGLVVGDFVFINEVGGITGINGQTGYVTTVVNPGQVQVTFQNAVLGGAYTTGGIAQYLTSRANTSIDCIRWYDGDQTNQAIVNPTFVAGNGWVNFMPPLSNSAFAIGDTPPAIYYLVGSRMILPFKDRLLFIGPVIQSSSGSPIYLQDAVVYSQNGTPYYTASFEGPASLPTSIPQPILVPSNQTADPRAYDGDIIGFGGAVFAGTNASICTASSNEDVLIFGFDRHLQTRFVYTGNDIVPFAFYAINAELGSSSTFSIVNMDFGVITRGSRGYIISNQNETKRIDLDIPDLIFEINLGTNGSERVTAGRDFVNEWIYETYPSIQNYWKFPNQTLYFNYRDNSYGLFNETYTTYGQFRRQTGFTWSTVVYTYPTWASWTEPWNSGESTSFNPEVAAGNQQGFIFIRDEGTAEASSLYIQSISSTTITSPNHCLNQGDYIIISGCLGSVGGSVNGKIYQVSVDSGSPNSFTVLGNTTPTGTYSGGGVITRLYKPMIQTKQFPVSWGMSRKTRIGPQQYLLTKTAIGQITLLIYLSQNSADAYNNLDFPEAVQIVPNPDSANNSLIYSTVLYTCPESTNLGLTPANINLQMPIAASQRQIWHRMNTSLIGDTIQLGFTMTDEQMRTLTPFSDSLEITGITAANPCVITVENELQVGNQVLIEDVEGMTQLNGNTYLITSRNDTSITIGVDSSSYTAYTDGGTVTAVSPLIQFSEIELHGFILDVTPSQMLA